jgi:hypothetical protein
MIFSTIHVLGASLVQSLPHPTGTDGGGSLTRALSIMFGFVGALAFLMIVVGGFRYIIAQDDSQKVSQAKSTILYAIIGLVVAALAEFIVTYVVGNFTP